MSGSPKYTTVAFDVARREQLAAARRRREEDRRRRREEHRQRRLSAGIRTAEARRDALTARMGELVGMSRGLPQHAQVTAATDQVVGLRRPTDEAGLSRIGRELRGAERRADELTVAVSRELTRQEQSRAVELAVAPLRGLTDGAQFDPVGHRTIAALLDDTRRRAGDARGFSDLHQRLGEAVGAHLETVRDRQAHLLRLATETDELSAQLVDVLADAAAAGLAVAEESALRAELTGLRQEAAGGHVDRWERRVAGLRDRVAAVTAATDNRLDQLDRMALIVEAASAALPAAGLRVVPDSLAERADAVVFVAERADGSPVEMTVYAGDADGNRLEYRTAGSDIVVENAVGGAISRCDLTEELLERFHAELADQGVATDGLHWEGKPGQPRPPAVEALRRPAHDDRSRS
ncbi:hypothetical protein [Micromonospora noduli]|uniref:hypothetical protein n=1 Tax=Micromonospora noduli TaxID=709876 RepID=UPI000DC5755F|nr:hypothetical protein [Micromonospora noduli]RAO13494.1 hypothetical protein LUPAC07_03786 [Micromonospora noduli]